LFFDKEIKMKLIRSFVSFPLLLSLVFVSFLSIAIQPVNAQDSKIAMQRGYRTGYSDGYMSGYRDAIENASRAVERHSEYARADRAYNKDYGALEDYRDGYQQGFELGYNTGFDKRSFDAALPVEIKRRGVIVPQNRGEIKTPENKIPANSTAEVKNEVSTSQTANTTTQTAAEFKNNDANRQQDAAPRQEDAPRNETISYVSTNEGVVVIPVDTELIVEILGDFSTEKSKVGDRFQARVVSPVELNGATVEGRISRIQKPNRIRRRAEMTLSFDQIRLDETRWANYSAILTEVLPIKGDNIKTVDAEGTVEGKSSVKSDGVKIGAATGTGLVVGAIAGGPVGAAVGAGVGAAFGVGAVVVQRGKHIKIINGQQLRVRTTNETRIR
jgi:hypothetical protein